MTEGIQLKVLNFQKEYFSLKEKRNISRNRKTKTNKRNNVQNLDPHSKYHKPA
jgi:hypothetical protein